MFSSRSYLSEITCTKPTFVRLPNDEYIPVAHKGTVNLTKTIVLEDVLCVPSFPSTYNPSASLPKISIVVVCLPRHAYMTYSIRE